MGKTQNSELRTQNLEFKTNKKENNKVKLNLNPKKAFYSLKRVSLAIFSCLLPC